ncbi:hypothetical protein EO98_15525 [Methanosarcina sp. 2.H.T.1A.6]|nr:hypothetical protein EO98_15525 [Methanosarcina sp. 2.H.T.1A.6]KKG24360.1 hypothetical protein EO96_14335 [Methanosarcina sp. 2.H.T.1A.8]KKG29153.1 hypothetical protein EO97_15660 [Methanosarcina sp. 2.H.T.1A.15]
MLSLFTVFFSLPIFLFFTYFPLLFHLPFPLLFRLPFVNNKFIRSIFYDKIILFKIYGCYVSEKVLLKVPGKMK